VAEKAKRSFRYCWFCKRVRLCYEDKSSDLHCLTCFNFIKQ
jgi:hypothetical protein